MVETQKGDKYILVIQGYYSKWIELFVCACHMAKDVAAVLVDEFFTCYGVCDRIHSDQGSEFDSHLMKGVHCLWKMERS